MPTIQANTLRQCGYELFEAAGCSLEGTQAVVDHLIESDLFGHHSHGAIRFYEEIGIWPEAEAPAEAAEKKTDVDAADAKAPAGK